MWIRAAVWLRFCFSVLLEKIILHRNNNYYKDFDCIVIGLSHYKNKRLFITE